MSERRPGEPWFLVSLGAFGSRVSERLETDRRYRAGWQPPTLSLRVEAGPEQRQRGPGRSRAERRRSAVETLRVGGPEGEAGPEAAAAGPVDFRAVDDRLRGAFLKAFEASGYLARRAAGDDRPVAASVAVVLDLTDPFSRAALAATFGSLLRVTRDHLAPMFRGPYRNLEVLVAGTVPMAERGRDGAGEIRRALEEVRAQAEAFEVGGSGEADLRVFLVDDRSDRYVLTEDDRVEQTALFVGAVLGAGPASADPMRELRSPAGERGRRINRRGAIFGTFSLASLSYPGGLVAEYCRLRQAYELLSAFRGKTADDTRGDLRRDGQAWLAGARSRLEARFAKDVGFITREIGPAQQAWLGFAFEGSWPPVRVGLLTPHTELGDPGHREVGFEVEPPPELDAAGNAYRTYWRPEQVPPAAGPIDRRSVGVVTTQKESEKVEPRPAPDARSDGASWIGKVRGFAEETLQEFVPDVVEAADMASADVLGASRQELRQRLDARLAGTITGLSECSLWLEELQQTIGQELEAARRELDGICPPREREPGRTPDPEKDWGGTFRRLLDGYHEWRKELEKRPLVAGVAIASAAVLAGGGLLLARTAPLLVGTWISNPVGAFALVFAALLVALAAPLALDLALSWLRLSRHLSVLGERLRAVATWLRDELFGQRVRLSQALWRVRALVQLQDEVKAERERLGLAEASLVAAIEEAKARLVAMGVRFLPQPDKTERLDDAGVLDARGLFQRWILPGGPLGRIYAGLRQEPAPLAHRYLAEALPFRAWREQLPFADLDAVGAWCAKDWSADLLRNPFEGPPSDETREEIRAFLARFAKATRAPLSLSALVDASAVDGDARREDPGVLDWAVLAAAPTDLVVELDRAAADVGLEMEPVGQSPRDRVLVIRSLVNVDLARLDQLAPSGPAGGGGDGGSR